MKKSTLFVLINLICTCSIFTSLSGQEKEEWMQQLEFVYLDEMLSEAQYDVRYASDNNFVGRVVHGYESERLVLTKQAAIALKKAETKFLSCGYGLKIFDTYRPTRAVNHFKTWARNVTDTLTKSTYYPDQDKRKLFKLGYISTKSGHSRGSTIDLTLYHKESGLEVDMGGSYDFFGEISHHGYTNLGNEQFEMRQLLKMTLSDCGFRSYSKEWWHYTLRREPYPKTYFDHVVR